MYYIPFFTDCQAFVIMFFKKNPGQCKRPLYCFTMPETMVYYAYKGGNFIEP